MGEMPPQPTGDEPLVEVPDKKLGKAFKRITPTHCQRGHAYRPGVSTSHWVGCRCSGARAGGHMRYYCDVPTEAGPCPDRRLFPECVDPERRARGHYQS